ncbi:DNA gyrase inhibitor YacG [Thalassotalea ponticola]|uniref:DNA gyrase inhibitor YacG n=1 Tax=Thalassotalea ponticola TaxID=1523392 RepID=UPI0025B39A4C|nr:DNA gyrase inhibitor YacG [Thalassotalea ponticola]MDN3653576.1 DNA gyrase inhibitor YacG [Thalassotalea ponticola]
MVTKVDCPTCKKTVVWNEQAKFRPFCSERCKLIDLGDWAEENHKISQPIQATDALSEDMLDALEDQFLQNNSFFTDAK